MLYEQYKVTDCWEREIGPMKQRVYNCELIGRRGHRIGFYIYIDDLELGFSQYKAIQPFIKIGDTLNCEFAWRMSGNNQLSLCISGIRIEKEKYYRGDWIRFPGLINCSGDAVLTTNCHDAVSLLMNSKSGRLVWTLNTKPNLLKRLFQFFFTSPNS
jgi:hypothetical protein